METPDAAAPQPNAPIPVVTVAIDAEGDHVGKLNDVIADLQKLGHKIVSIATTHHYF